MDTAMALFIASHVHLSRKSTLGVCVPLQNICKMNFLEEKKMNLRFKVIKRYKGEVCVKKRRKSIPSNRYR